MARASPALKCQELFPSQNETLINIQGVVFNPTSNLMPGANSVRFSGRTSASADWSIQRTQIYEYDPDYIGFVPTPDQVRMTHLANNYYRGLKTFVESFDKRVTPSEIQNILNSDALNFWKFIDQGRMGYALAVQNQNYSGFIRVLDCTDYSRVFRESRQTPLNNSDYNQNQDYLSPTERNAIAKGHRIKFYEIGKVVKDNKQRIKL